MICIFQSDFYSVTFVISIYLYEITQNSYFKQEIPVVNFMRQEFESVKILTLVLSIS